MSGTIVIMVNYFMFIVVMMVLSKSYEHATCSKFYAADTHSWRFMAVKLLPF